MKYTIQEVRDLFRKSDPYLMLPESLQSYPKKLGRLNDVCETCHERIKTGVLVVKEPKWEHFKCWRLRKKKNE